MEAPEREREFPLCAPLTPDGDRSVGPLLDLLEKYVIRSWPRGISAEKRGISAESSAKSHIHQLHIQ